jgi:UTP-glucose-1-phosphate uridylyltransferase
MKPVRKAVFPVAGLGARFLPATKASPKEMLAVVDKPLIQYAVEEAVVSGISELIFVTVRHKRAIEDHFDASPELETEFKAKGKLQLAAGCGAKHFAQQCELHFCTPVVGSVHGPCGAVRPACGWQRAFCRFAGRQPLRAQELVRALTD